MAEPRPYQEDCPECGEYECVCRDPSIFEDANTGLLRDANRTLIFERENWNRLYHEQGAKIAAYEEALRGLLALTERLGQGIPPVCREVAAARDMLLHD